MYNNAHECTDLDGGADVGLVLTRSGFCEPGVMYTGDQVNCCCAVLTAVTVDVELTSAGGVIVDIGRVLPSTSCSASSSVGVARLRLVSVAPEHSTRMLPNIWARGVKTLGKFLTPVCLCSPSSTNWYRLKGGDALRLGPWGVKAGMVCVWVAGKTV